MHLSSTAPLGPSLVTSAALPHPTLRLRPGLVVVRRDRDLLQVGTRPGRSLTLPDHPDVRRLLADLRPEPDHAAPWSDATGLPEVAARALARLDAAGLLTEAAPPRATATTLARVVAHHDGLEDDVDRLRGLLATAGVPAVDGPGDDSSHDAVVEVHLARHEADRDLLDEAQRAGRAALVVTRGWPGPAVGPFVAPGLTACLRCVDAHLTDLDPRWPVVVTQAARSPEPAVVDPATWSLALAWAVADVARWGTGEQPSSWSTTHAWDDGPVPHTRAWTRHPCCGCAWDRLAVD